MQLHQLKYFVAIVETGSITAAAEKCFISQPSISQQLAKLEGSLNQVLFNRQKGKLQLTEAGQLLYQQAREILVRVEKAKHEVENFAVESGGSLALGILPTLAPYLLTPLLTQLSQKFPRALLSISELQSAELISALQVGQLDVIIDALPINNAQINTEALFRDEFYLAVLKQHELANCSEISIGQVGEHAFILLEDLHCLSQQIQQFCLAQQFTPKVMFQAAQISTVKQLISSGYGISILPNSAKTKMEDSQICYIPFKTPTPHRQIVMAKNQQLSPAADYFCQCLKQLSLAQSIET